MQRTDEYKQLDTYCEVLIELRCRGTKVEVYCSLYGSTIPVTKAFVIDWMRNEARQHGMDAALRDAWGEDQTVLIYHDEPHLISFR